MSRKYNKNWFEKFLFCVRHGFLGKKECRRLELKTRWEELEYNGEKLLDMNWRCDRPTRATTAIAFDSATHINNELKTVFFYAAVSVYRLYWFRIKSKFIDSNIQIAYEIKWNKMKCKKRCSHTPLSVVISLSAPDSIFRARSQKQLNCFCV